MDDESRFRALFNGAYPVLHRYAANRGLSGPDGDDLVAGTLEIAWRRIDEVPPDDPLPWLYAVARNLLRNQRRREGRRAAILARFRPSLVQRTEASDGDPGVLHPDAVRTALASLREDDREVLRLVAWDGLTPAQVAIVMGCSAVAARSRLHRARNRLAARLGLDPRAQRPMGSRQKQGDRSITMEAYSDRTR